MDPAIGCDDTFSQQTLTVTPPNRNPPVFGAYSLKMGRRKTRKPPQMEGKKVVYVVLWRIFAAVAAGFRILAVTPIPKSTFACPSLAHVPISTLPLPKTETKNSQRQCAQTNKG